MASPPARRPSSPLPRVLHLQRGPLGHRAVENSFRLATHRRKGLAEYTRRSGMPTFLLTLTMVLGLVGGVLASEASPLARQVAPSLLQTAEISVGGVPLTVELAYQPADRALGLGPGTPVEGLHALVT